MALFLVISYPLFPCPYLVLTLMKPKVHVMTTIMKWFPAKKMLE
ncbi:hypothetical protein EV13_1676 [Prochlorococcus sp. MIT 0702]|nr:hypothetical protein EV12_3126 [Prochlorococcus sp. MIT 0701]KGG26776.1 hypothetical protein EV12_1557 [Prochlorococcus sp. MIT 0701]KGG28263.1 hypothetical protein EV13_1676 [Prochlorococcus sp. MIT 0702]KGG31480.1 hypothetical protein EV14_2272 [Prochlorococcus sp. MIT 0703]